MDKLLIRGGRALKGTMTVSGAKNAALPELCATLLTDETVTLRNVPKLQDIATMVKLIRHMGVEVQQPEDGVMRLCAQRLEQPEAPYDLVKTMRASVLVLGPLIARMWPVTLTYFCYGWCLWLYLSFLLIFFKDKFSLSTSESALFATIVYTIGAVGNTVGGIVSDRILHTSTNIRRARVGAAVFGFVGALLSLLPILQANDKVVVAVCLSAGFFFAEMVIGPMWAIPMTPVTPTQVASLPPMTQRWPRFVAAGTSVVTSISQGAKSSETCSQISRMALRFA